jgi:hypothetical protein
MTHRVECLTLCECNGEIMDLGGFLSEYADRLALVRHPLGFIDVVDQGSDLRTSRYSSHRVAIHIWSREYEQRESPRSVCHRHGWPMRSRIEYGTIANTIYQVTPESVGETWIEHEVGYGEGSSVAMRCLQSVRATPQPTCLLSSGSTYYMDADQYHDSECISELAVTVADIGPRTTSSTVVYPDSADLGAKRSRSLLSSSERSNLLGWLIDQYVM